MSARATTRSCLIAPSRFKGSTLAMTAPSGGKTVVRPVRERKPYPGYHDDIIPVLSHLKFLCLGRVPEGQAARSGARTRIASSRQRRSQQSIVGVPEDRFHGRPDGTQLL